ncbi:MAG TPA: tRNA lysidine(34) synthetase TilS [Candidatus Marinimicrobia bacterium]|nr:tRNA lysidine(34) synthetase TilS [Candidatus Neomarinimicrobiota bacterium]
MPKKVKGIEIRFREGLLSSQLIEKGSSGLLAVSGGVDSVVIAHLFAQVRESFRLTLAVAHFNHSLRGEESDADEAFVKDWAKALDLPFFSAQWVSSELSNWEERAREARYGFLDKTCQQLGCDWIATAHHADDQAETLLMRLVEGSGYRGLRGIPERNGKVVRPLLKFTKAELTQYASENGLSFREDSSNQDTRFQRNRIRENILPQIQKLNSHFSQTVQRTVSNMVEVAEWVDGHLRDLYGKAVSVSENGLIQIDEKELRKVPPLLQKELVREVVNENDLPWRGHVWDDLSRFLQKATVGDIMILPDNCKILKDRHRFLIMRVTGEGDLNSFHLDTATSVSLKAGDHIFTMDLTTEPTFSSESETEFIDFDQLDHGSIRLRPWQAGDRMVPVGMSGRKKVSDILVDAKVDRFSKMSKYVLTSAHKIVWLCGLRLDNRFKVTSATASVARLNWSHIDGQGEQ